MFLSDEQNSVALFGIRGKDEPAWSVVDVPVGPQPIPLWARDMAVYWADQYGNAPSFKLKSRGNLRRWPNKWFKRIGDCWLAEAPDGRAEAYYQGGALAPVMLKRFQTLDGKLHAYRPQTGQRITEELEGGGTINHVPYDDGEWVEVERLCTRQEQGFGGSHIDITMEDGTEVTLRGPWHGPCPDGFVELAYVDTTDRYYSAYSRTWPQWHQRGGTGGLLVRQELFQRLFARFLPHLTLVQVNTGNGDRLQPLKPEWREPKAWVQARERLARKQAEWNAMAPEERPPHVLCNWPKVCGGKAHCAVAECNHCTRRPA